MLLIAWDLDGTLVHVDTVPRHTGPLAERGTPIDAPDGNRYYVYLRPHAVEALRWFMERKDDYACVLFSAADGSYIDLVLDSVIYPAIAGGHRFERVYDRSHMTCGEKNVLITCGRDIFFDDAILVDDVWSNCASCGCASVFIPRYDPYREEGDLFDDAQQGDRVLLQVMANIRDGTFLKFKPDTGDRKYAISACIC